MCVMKVKKHLIVGSVADPGCWTRILFFSFRIQVQKDTGSGSATKKLSIFNPNKCYKALGNMIHEFISDPGSEIISTPVPGVKKNPRSRIRIRNTDWRDVGMMLLLMQCCDSGMFISDPDFYPSRIPDSTTAPKGGGGGTFLSYHFL